MGRVTLLTDFGTRDGYVGALKGVIAGIFPGVIVDDVSHDLAPGDVAAAGRTLTRYWDQYPVGTVHLAVVDPGVGTARRALAVEADRRLLVAPDNGLLSGVLRRAGSWRAVEISNPDYLPQTRSATFHGRDLFAPASAFLARGLHLSRLGAPVTDPILLEEPIPSDEEGTWTGEVVSTDRFGNLITNLPAACVRPDGEVEIRGTRVPVRSTYGEVAPREAVALVNSDGCLEVAARDSSAAELLGAGVGTRVRFLLPTRGPRLRESST